MKTAPRRAALLVLSALLSVSCAQRAHLRLSGADVLACLEGPGSPAALWGVSVRSLSDGRPLLKENADKPFVPASVMKLFTTAAALVKLGPGFRYETGVYAAGPVEKGVLKGDLVVRGSGDPTISAAFHGRAEAVFEQWADRLKARGIGEIAGDVIGDASLFGSDDLGPGWAWDDEAAPYSARISALSFDDNCFDVIVTPGAGPGEAAAVAVEPEADCLRVKDGVTTSEGETKIEAHRRFGGATTTLSGAIDASGPPVRLRFAAPDPALYAMSVLVRVLRAKGIVVDGHAAGTRQAPGYDGMALLFSHRSEPLSRIVEETNKRSRNLYAELLFRTMGAASGGPGSNEASVAALRRTLAGMGIDAGALAIFDGSGLSRLDLVTPDAVVSLLAYMARHPSFGSFYRSLPIAGVDGTLVRRMGHTAAQGRVRAKTGTMTHVVSLAGYAPDGRGGLVAFCVMSNNCLAPAGAVRLLEDRFCRGLVGR